MELPIIRELTSKKVINLDQVLALSDLEQTNLKSKIIQELIVNNTITFEQVLSLNYVQRRNLELDLVQNLIAKKIISLGQVLALPKILSDLEQTNLGSEAIQKLLSNHTINFNQALSLNPIQRENLELAIVQELINNNSMNLNQILSLKEMFYMNNNQTKQTSKISNDQQLLNIIKSKKVIAFTKHGIIRNDEELNWTDKQQINFNKVKNLFSLMKETSISIDRVLNLTDQERFNLNCKKVRKFLREKKLSLDGALQLTENQRKNLRSRNVDNLIKNNFIKLEELLKISDDKSTYLSSNRLYDLISEGLITIEQAFKLPSEKISNLTSVTTLWAKRSDDPDNIHCRAPIPSHNRNFFGTVLEIIRKGYIAIEQFFQLNYNQMNDLLRWNVEGTRVLIVKSKIIFDANGHPIVWPNLTFNQEKNLICMAVSELILDGTITYEAALELTNNHRRALKEPDIKERLRNGELTLADLDEYAESDAESDENYPIIFINNAQSTHTTSVHQSVSESAIRLYKRYGNQMNLSLEKIISEIKKKLESLTKTGKKEVALLCFERLTEPTYSFTDRRSEVSTKQLMALFDLALFDESNYLFTNEASKEQGYNSALKIWVDTLNEIQRGYNTNESDRDIYICASGTFNKFIEKLCGIHTDCQIDFLTLETANLKFLALSKEEAIKRYLELGNDPEKLTDEFDWQEKIFSLISDLVKEKLFIEFRPLFSTEKNPEGNPQHPKLLEIIKQMEYISIKKFDMENYIKNNKGIKLSSNTLNNASFFSIESNDEISCPNTPKVCLLK